MNGAGAADLFSPGGTSTTLRPLAALVTVVAAVACAPGPGVLTALWCAGAALACARARRTALTRLASGSAVVGLVALALRAGLPQDGDRFVRVAASMLTVAAWATWFRQVSSWPRLKSALRRAGLPNAALDLLDQSIVCGLQLLADLIATREAVLFRAGPSADPTLFAHHGLILAVATSRAFDRAFRQEQAVLFRGAPSLASAGVNVELSGATVRRAADTGSSAPPEATLLDGVTLRFEPGEWIIVAGPNGAGKTTLIRVLVGLEALSEGRLVRLGEHVTARAPAGRMDGRVALVQQDPDHQLLGCTPREDVAWGLRRRGVPESELEPRVESALSSLGLIERADDAVALLSQGQRKRVALAAALATEPALLLCDEPTAGLDPVASMRLVRHIEDLLVRRRTTVVWVTHELASLPERAARVVLLAKGRVLFDGPRREALEPTWLRRASLLHP